MTLRCFNAREVRLASVLIAGLELIWAWIVYFDGRGRLSSLLEIFSAREEFSAFMALAAAMIIVGCVRPDRRLRHQGLWTTALLCFSVFCFMAYHGVYGLMFASLPWVGAMALVVQFMDSMGKPRRETLDR